MSSGNHYLLITCLCTWVMPLLVLGGNGGHPPRILTHPSADVAFKELESVELVCEAQGSPKPQYYWEKDGERVELSDGPDGVMLKNGSGTLVIHMPLPASHNGYYQCFAYNDFGVAVTTKAYVKKAELVSFPSVRVPQVHRPDVGAPLTLYCKPPKSHPSGVIYWGETSSGSRLHPINNTDRVSQDYSGNLHFTHIEPGDYLNNEMYICIVKEDVAIRGLVTGSDQRINPVHVTPTYRPPERMWSSGPKEIAIRGEPKRMKCIFSGYPTPRVTWSRVGRVDNYSVGQEITIERASPDDAGQYRCSARNSDSGQPVSIDIELAVESAPHWRRGRSPQDATVAEDDDVEFECVADGVPAPTVSWSFNGRPYNKTLQLMPDSRPIVSKDRVTFLSVMKNDSQVLQCNASNVHGYILANAYLSVRAEPPSILQAPVDKLKVAEGRSAMFSCRMDGAPKPTIKWTRGDSKTLVAEKRFIVQTSGDLEILDASVEDSDVYYCTGKNKLGEETVHGQLIVRNKTLITEPPWSQTVNLSSRVKFECKATTDQHEMSGLTITWYKDDQPLDLSSHMNTSFIVINDSLIIDTAQVSDSGAYKCRADNKVDSDEVTVQLIVRDRPQAPTNVRLDRCMTNRAELSWIASVDNNDRIQEYVVFYNSSHDPPDSYHVGIRTHMTSAIVHPLSPWTNYTFHVTAQNSMGMSDRSAFTHALCLTPQARPFQSPTHVCTHNGKPEELVIMWKPMQRSELNGENFHYMVKYSPAPERGQDGDIAQETTVNVSDWQQREVVIPNQGTYRRFRISVLAANDKGTAPENQAIVVYGHSSEGVPSVVPENFRIKEETLNRTSVVFMWDPVNTDAVNGFFKGFQVRFWKRGNADDVRREDLILNNPPADCDLNSKKSLKPSRLRRQESLTSYSLPTHRLWGGATISAAAVVMNRVSAGALSDAIQFTTPEGVPEAVSSFSVLERGVRHLKLGWKPPSEINGILDHFIISYTVSSGSSHSKFEKIDNPQQTTDKIVDLQPETTYNISISAHTATGGGPETTIVASTRSEPLDVPCIDNITLGEDFVVITWRPSCENPVKNPGIKFVVEYHTEDMMEQNTSSIEMPYDLVNLTGLSPGKTYEIVVVAMNKAGEKTSSKPETFVLGHPPEPILQTSGISIWIIILILAILLFLLIIFLICCIKQRRQGKYPVYEKEKLHGCNPDNNEEEPKFGEYTKSNAPTLRPTSHGSVDSMEKPLESETNSLAEYEDTDPMKFNEDGSFIGQYGGQKKVAPTADHNAPFVAIV